MGLKGKIEAIIYAAEEPVTLEQIAFLMKEAVLQELAGERERAAEEQDAQKAALTAETAEPSDADAAQASDPQPDSDGGAIAIEEQTAPAQDEPAQEPAPVESAPIANEPDADPDVRAETVAIAAELSPSAQAAPTEASENSKPAIAHKRKKYDVPPEVKARVRELIRELIADFANADRGIEVRQLAGGYRMATKPEHHDIVKAFAKSLKPPLRLSLPALETLAVVAYKQPVTAPEVSEIRGVDSQGVMATLLERKLVTTAGRKAVIGRPILYKTTKEFLLRFGLNDVSELPSMEEFEKLAQKEFFNDEIENDPALIKSEGEVEPSDNIAAEAMDESVSSSPTEMDEPSIRPEAADPSLEGAATGEADNSQPTSEMNSTEADDESVKPESVN